MATGKKQGARGLGIEAQRNGVANYLNGGRWTLLQDFVEVESGAKSDNRPSWPPRLRCAACTRPS